MKYCPIIDRNLNTGICGVGQVGVFRLVNSDYGNSDSTLLRQIGELDQPFQPEWENFVVADISMLHCKLAVTASNHAQ